VFGQKIFLQRAGALQRARGVEEGRADVIESESDGHVGQHPAGEEHRHLDWLGAGQPDDLVVEVPVAARGVGLDDRITGGVGVQLGAERIARESGEVAELSRAQNESPEPGHRHEPLEDYPLEAFKLLGTMKRNGVTEGVVSVGDKTQHVQVGQYIGQNYGRIVRVGDQELTLRELVREGTTEWKEKVTTLKVQEGAQ